MLTESCAPQCSHYMCWQDCRCQTGQDVVLVIPQASIRAQRHHGNTYNLILAFDNYWTKCLFAEYQLFGSNLSFVLKASLNGLTTPEMLIKVQG